MSGDTGDDRGTTDPDAGDRALTHVDREGAAQMVDVGGKPNTRRSASAQGTLLLRPETIDAIRENSIEKGEVLPTARIGAIRAVKHTWEQIPMCHQIPITNVDTGFELDNGAVTLSVTVETIGKTGCEMEALQGVTTGLDVVWDMVKAAEKDDDGQYPVARIEGVRVTDKTIRDQSG